MPFQAWIRGDFNARKTLEGQLQWGHALSGMDTPGHNHEKESYREASMGPCPFRHGYSINFSSSCRIASTLQWGHALSGMDTNPHCPRTHRAGIASMGPCPFRHGYLISYAPPIPECTGFNGAMPFQAWIHPTLARGRNPEISLQWGHALSGMDTPSLHLNLFFHQIASMGPCPFRHGYSGKDVRVVGYRHELQWGHAFSGMDIANVGDSLAVYLTVLQWGHAFSGMDILVDFKKNPNCKQASMGPCLFRHGYNAQSREARRSVIASMGPCLFRHGYVRKSEGDLAIELALQWGHAFSGMDIVGNVKLRKAHWNASMGPCLFRHGYLSRSEAWALWELASMGPCLFRHGYGKASTSTGA